MALKLAKSDSDRIKTIQDLIKRKVFSTPDTDGFLDTLASFDCDAHRVQFLSILPELPENWFYALHYVNADNHRVDALKIGLKKGASFGILSRVDAILWVMNLMEHDASKVNVIREMVMIRANLTGVVKYETPLTCSDLF